MKIQTNFGDIRIPSMSVNELRDHFFNKNMSVSEFTKERMEALSGARHLNIFITETPEMALKQAAKSDERIQSGKQLPLDGIPLAVKDNFCMRDIKTTAGSKSLSNYYPVYESSITQKLLSAGSVCLGKVNMDEFAMGSSTESSFFGPTINPAGVKLGFNNLVPGGSSGGSAAAVAGNLTPASIGTDTGGSIRQPASFCGIVGMKPTYGLCSRWGIIAYGSSLDQAGAFGKTVKDVAILLDVMIGEDPKDTTSVKPPFSNLEQSTRQHKSKLKISVPKELRLYKNSVESSKVWERAEKIATDLSAEIVEVSMPNLEYALPAYYIIALSEASSNLARYDGVKFGHRTSDFSNITDLYEKTRAEGFGDEVKRRILLGTFSLSSGYYDEYYQKAMKVRRLVVQDFARAFEKSDVMIMPTTPAGAFEIGRRNLDPVENYLEDMYTVPINLAGLPAISIPIEKDERGMPLGLQIIGGRFDDQDVVQVATMFETALSN